jgi:hypothetical protein
MGQLVKLAGFVNLVPPACVADKVIVDHSICTYIETDQPVHLEDGKAGAEAMHMCMPTCDTDWLPVNTLLPAGVCCSNAIVYVLQPNEEESAASPLSDGDDMKRSCVYVNMRMYGISA